MAQTPKTVVDVLKAGTDFLAGKGIEQPRFACELLVSRLLNCKRLDLYLKFDHVLSERLLEALRRGTKRLADGEPVQYVLRQWDFMGHKLTVDKRALIPRPETEGLVTTVLEDETLWQLEKPSIIDVGTGSGCIVISLALAKPQGLYVALDTSSEALQLARENAAALGVAERVAFSEGELSDTVDAGTIDAIVANLPYIATADYEQLPPSIRRYEPRAALDGGPEGLTVIESVAQDASFALKPAGRLFLEIGYDQAERVHALLSGLGFGQIATRPDLAGKDRVVTAVLEGDGG